MIKQGKTHQRKISVYISVTSAVNGFSLIEIIVAIGIVSVGIISIISLFSVSLKDEVRSKNKVVAVYLAQEALEVVRWQRDTNWKNRVVWGSGISTGNRMVSLIDEDDITSGWEIAVSNPPRRKIYYHAANNYYAQSKNAPLGLEETKFERWLTIASDCGADCLTATVYVSHPNLSQDVQMSTRLYDWMP